MADPILEGPLARYWQKRDFDVTAEPRGELGTPGGARAFVVQKHAASRLHYDFRLELDGVLVSWALPKGPSFDPTDKRIAVHVEDHPLSYASFEGTIPPRQYGAGHVIVWDNGRWEPVGDPAEGLRAGKLLFTLHGQKLRGQWELVKIAKPGDKQELWILFKKRDGFARPRAAYDVLSALPDSIIAKPLMAAPAPATEASRPGLPAGAVPAPQPERLEPQLATLATRIPTAGRWTCEIKFDGYRLMACIRDGRARLITRGGHDWSQRMPGLVAELEALGLDSAWLDGEIVVMSAAGVPSFNALQKAFDRRTPGEAIDYFLFDVPYLEGVDLRKVEFAARRRLLQGVLDRSESAHLRFSADFPGDPATVLESVRRMGLEGVVAKRVDAPYVSGRTDRWLKLKFRLRQEFVVCGYTDRSDGAPQIGSLLLGVHDEAGALRPVGSVGTGWDARTAAALKKKLAALETGKVPHPDGPPSAGRWSRRAAGSERWVRPTLVAEVEFAEVTPDGQVRHATFLGLREDKPAAAVRWERAEPPAAGLPLPAAARGAGGVKVSHGERVIDAVSGLTKLDLVRYYESVAEFMLPHLRARPCSLVRGPEGVGGQLFFQKHAERTAIPGIKTMDPALWPKHDALLEIDSPLALAGAAQMNVIEFHTWNSVAKKIDAPDRMIFDIDPGEGTPWQQIQEAATLVHTLLDQLGLASWLKTSGGKGLHVVVPLAPRLDYGTVKDFSEAVVQHLARVIPARFVARSGPANRVGKVFVDYLRNGQGATTAAAFSARARPGLGVSMPVAWEDLPGLRSGAHWTVATAREHLSFQTVDPWQAYWTCRQTLAKPMRNLGFKRG